MKRNTILLQAQAEKIRLGLNQLFLKDGNITTESIAFDLIAQQLLNRIDEWRLRIDQMPTEIVIKDEVDATTLATDEPVVRPSSSSLSSQSPSRSPWPSDKKPGNDPSKPPVVVYRPNVPFMSNNQGHPSRSRGANLDMGMALDLNSIKDTIFDFLG